MKPPHLLLNAPLTRRAALIHSNAGPVPNHIVHKVNPGSCKASAQSRSICLKSQPWIAPVVAACSMGKVDGASRNDAGATVSSKYRRIFADSRHFPPILRIFGRAVTHFRRAGWHGAFRFRRRAPQFPMPVATREMPILTLFGACPAAITITFRTPQAVQDDRHRAGGPIPDRCRQSVMKGLPWRVTSANGRRRLQERTRHRSA